MRAKRIVIIALALSMVVAALCLHSHIFLLEILPVQFLPFSLIIANFLLIPFEASIQRIISRNAAQRLKELHPTVIGITGSFGKTSVKHILGHILEMHAPTLYTPGSVNTLMGIARIIRERLEARTQYFIVEMGAYGRGSIARLCHLTPPQVGIITAIGDAHYERFKSLDAVAHAKFELAEAVLEAGEGKIIIHETVLKQDYAKQFVVEHRERFVICGASMDADYHLLESKQTSAGLDITLDTASGRYEITAPLFGLQHTGNIVMAFAAAAALGLSPERIVAALRTVPQIKHRLEVKPQTDGTVYIDDGFNSNQAGFEAALGLLNTLGSLSGKRKILITPGILELGEKHDAIHRLLGAEAGRSVDIALIVQSGRIPSFVGAFMETSPDKTLERVGSLAEAQAWIKDHGLPGDIILIENDLPDLGEASFSA
jgi:UDP-N-acetylmuramoyl-tripeptide--D-alanyl-D-alanine ligase